MVISPMQTLSSGLVKINSACIIAPTTELYYSEFNSTQASLALVPMDDLFRACLSPDMLGCLLDKQGHPADS